MAFEADPELGRENRQRFAEHIRDQRLIIVEGAIVDGGPGARGATITFYRNAVDTVWGTISTQWAHRNAAIGSRSEAVQVPIVDLDDCVRRYGIPHYMKVDIEGADLACLRMLFAYSVRPHYVSIESDKTSYRAVLGEIRLLRELGYSRFKAIQQATVSAQRSPIPALEGNDYSGGLADGASGLFGRETPGRWRSGLAVSFHYCWIFALYKLFGDAGILRNCMLGEKLRWLLMVLLRQPIPGWYDTHAMHSEMPPDEMVSRYRLTSAALRPGGSS